MTAPRSKMNLSEYTYLSKTSKRIVVLDYKDELLKGMNAFMAFTLSLSNSAFSSCMMIQFGYGLKTGGAISMVYGWIVIGFFTVLVSFALSEICSAYPAEGGTYYWTGVLAPKKYAPILSYLVGYTYLISFLFGTPSIASSLGTIMSGLTEFFGGQAWTESAKVLFSIFLLALISVKGILRIDHQGYFHDAAGILQIVGTITIVVIIFTVSPALSSNDFVFGSFNNTTGFSSHFYVIYIGSLFTTYTLSGFEAAGTCAEETINESVSAPKGMVYNVLVSYSTGFIFVLAVLYGCQNDYDYIVNSTNSATVNLFSMVFNGNQKGVIIMCILQFSMIIMTSFTGITVGSRLMFAMSRDKALPFSDYFHYLDPKRKSPDRIILIIFVLQSLISCLPLFSTDAFTLLCLISCVGIQITYMIPIALRLTSARYTFEQSDWNYGKFSLTIHTVALIGLLLITIALLLPTEYDSENGGITKSNFNYTSVILGEFYLLIMIFWFLPKIGARHHYKGPKAPHIVFSMEESVHSVQYQGSAYQNYQSINQDDSRIQQ